MTEYPKNIPALTKSAALVVLLAASASAQSAVVVWNGLAGDGEWNTAGNWDSGSQPTAADEVEILNGDSVSDTGNTVDAFVLRVGGSSSQLTLTDSSISGNKELRVGGTSTASSGVLSDSNGTAQLSNSGGDSNIFNVVIAEAHSNTAGTHNANGSVTFSDYGNLLIDDTLIVGSTYTDSGADLSTEENATASLIVRDVDKLSVGDVNSADFALGAVFNTSTLGVSRTLVANAEVERVNHLVISDDLNVSAITGLTGEHRTTLDIDARFTDVANLEIQDELNILDHSKLSGSVGGFEGTVDLVFDNVHATVGDDIEIKSNLNNVAYSTVDTRFTLRQSSLEVADNLTLGHFYGSSSNASTDTSASILLEDSLLVGGAAGGSSDFVLGYVDGPAGHHAVEMTMTRSFLSHYADVESQIILDGTLILEIAGLTRASSSNYGSAGIYSAMDLVGDLWIGGDLQINLIDDFMLSFGDAFEIIDLTDGILSGGFSSYTEGALVGNYNGVDLFITYMGGDGNDIYLCTDLSDCSTGVVSTPAPLVLLGVLMLPLLRRMQ